jgi:hypothetical protein
MQRRRSMTFLVRWHRWILAACLILPGVLTMLASFANLPASKWMLGIYILPGVAAAQALWGRTRASSVTRTVGSFATLVLIVTMGNGPGLLLLAVRGKTVTAEITGWTVDRRSDGHCYRLREPDGSAIRGAVCLGDRDLTVGDTIKVLVEPDDLADAVAVGRDTVATQAAWYLVPGAVALAVLLLACAATPPIRYSRRRATARPRTLWVVWRRDGDGVETVVSRPLSRTAAAALAKRLGIRHRQHDYWRAKAVQEPEEPAP